MALLLPVPVGPLSTLRWSFPADENTDRSVQQDLVQMNKRIARQECSVGVVLATPVLAEPACVRAYGLVR